MRVKRPTLAQKKFLKSKGLNPANWLVASEDKLFLRLVHRDTGNPRTIRKEES